MMNSYLQSGFHAGNQRAKSSIDNSLDELNYLHDKLDVEIIEIQAAVSAVGDNPEKVERYLKDRLGYTLKE